MIYTPYDTSVLQIRPPVWQSTLNDEAHREDKNILVFFEVRVDCDSGYGVSYFQMMKQFILIVLW